MKRAATPKASEERWIIDLFKRGDTLATVKYKTNNAFPDSVYEGLRQAAAS